MEKMKLVLPGMSREFLKCDPAVHEEGKTFFQVTKLLQGYIENEVDMNPSQNCKSQCGGKTTCPSRSLLTPFVQPTTTPSRRAATRTCSAPSSPSAPAASSTANSTTRTR